MLIKNNKSGFTLAEMSIVILIIGLLAGGIFVGLELKNQAAIRGQIKQLEEYSTAVNTFSSKYGNLPGDVPPENANVLGLATRTGDINDGDADGMIETCDAGGFSPLFGCERLLFWADLSSVGLVVGNFLPSPPFPYYLTALDYKDSLQYFPKMKMTDKGTLIPMHCQSAHYFVLNYIHVLIGLGGILAATGSMASNAEVYGMDVKIDDGLPLTGRMQYKAHALTGPIGTIGDNPFCLTLPTPNELPSTCMTVDKGYDLTDTTIGQYHCHPIVQMH